MRNGIGYFCLFLGIGIVLYVLYVNSRFSTVTRTFSPYTFLSSSWEKYKGQFINKDGRVVDYSQNSITTSEGQSYAMLRAVWVDDKATFDTVWHWTKTTMKRKNDNLFGWKWGKTGNTYGFLPDGGENAASDADTDIAFALILAGRRWQQESYTKDAEKILPDIWTKETAVIFGKRYLIAGNWAQNENELIINPSYFAPYAWRVFATVDSKHNWNSMIEPAYDLLTKSSNGELNGKKGIGLPPNWLSISRKDGKISAPTIGNLDTNYGYDAIRVPLRVGIDVFLNNDSTAKAYLSSFHYLSDLYGQSQKLDATYVHDGVVQQEGESPSMYGTIIGAFLTIKPEYAQKIYENKIVKLYSNTTNGFDKNIPYYEQNMLWFGAALYNKQISTFSK